MNDAIYVVGHVNPDTDSIAAALGYAWLLREKDSINAIGARAGAMNLQTLWVLDKLEMEAPELLTDASPRFEAVTRRFDTIYPDSPLREAWLIASRTSGVVPVINLDGTPLGLINGLTLFSYLSDIVGPQPDKRDMKISEFLDIPAIEAADREVPQFLDTSRIRDAITKIYREERNHFLVIDKRGKYKGVCRQKDLLNPPRLRIVMVDHNEPDQSIVAVEDAELLEILDHHRLGNRATTLPIRFTVDIVGSTSTLVYERIEEAGFSAPPSIAGLLLAGVISDTLMHSSPTTTERDRRASEKLARWAFAWDSPLEGETLEKYSKKILKAGADISSRDPDDVVSSDIKTYEAGGFKFAVSQAEVTNIVQLEEQLKELHGALTNMRILRQLDFALLMVTDVVRGSSILLLDNLPSVLDDLPYPRLVDGTLKASGMVSRKKQLLPVILSLLEN